MPISTVIPFSHFVKVTSTGVSATFTFNRLNALVMSNPSVPQSLVSEYLTLEAVGKAYGLQSPEYKYAAAFFGYISKTAATPERISFYRWVPEGAPAALKGAAIPDIAAIKQSGGFIVEIDGKEQEVNVDLSAVTSFAEAAQAITSALSGSAVCAYDNVSGGFIISVPEKGAAHTIGYASSPAGSGGGPRPIGLYGGSLGALDAIKKSGGFKLPYTAPATAATYATSKVRSKTVKTAVYSEGDPTDSTLDVTVDLSAATDFENAATLLTAALKTPDTPEVPGTPEKITYSAATCINTVKGGTQVSAGPIQTDTQSYILLEDGTQVKGKTAGSAIQGNAQFLCEQLTAKFEGYTFSLVENKVKITANNKVEEGKNIIAFVSPSTILANTNDVWIELFGLPAYSESKNWTVDNWKAIFTPTPQEVTPAVPGTPAIPGKQIATAVYKTDAASFVLSPAAGVTSLGLASAPASGTDLSAPLCLTAETGAVAVKSAPSPDISSVLGLSQSAGASVIEGLDARTFAEALNDISMINGNWVSVSSLTELTPATDFETASKWTAASEGRYCFVANDPSPALKTSAIQYESLFGNDGFIGNATADTNMNAFTQAAIASVDFSAVNGAMNFNFIEADAFADNAVGTAEELEAINAQRFNCAYIMGGYGQAQTLYGEGNIFGGTFSDISAFAGNTWLKAQLEIYGANALIALPLISLRGAGRSVLLTALQEPVNLAKTGGIIVPVGIGELTAIERTALITAAGDPDTPEIVEQNGYYMAVQPLTAEDISIKRVRLLLIYTRNVPVNRVVIQNYVLGA